MPSGKSRGKLMSIPSDQLYLLQNGEQAGPFPAAAVRSMIESGALSPEDLTWYEGLPEWRALSTVFPGIRRIDPALTKASAKVDPYPEEESFGSLLSDAFSYPFRGDGFILLLAGSIFLTFVGFLSRFGGFLTLSLMLFYFGYTASMLQNVLNGSGHGEKVLPKWPDFTDWQSDVIEPALKWIGTFVFVLGPGIACVILLGPLGYAVLGVGYLYLPMAFMLVGMFDTLMALNPVFGIKSIFAILGHYILTLVVLGGLTAVNVLTGELSDMVDGIPLKIAAGFVDGFNNLYTLVLFARILGCLYRVNRHKLGWF